MSRVPIPMECTTSGRNTGFVNVGTDHDAGPFAVASIRRWWRAEGRRLYPGADRILFTADAGGSNGSRLRLWRVAWQASLMRSRSPPWCVIFHPGPVTS